MRGTGRRDIGATTYFDIGSTTYFLVAKRHKEHKTDQRICKELSKRGGLIVGVALRGRPFHDERVSLNNGRPQRAAPTITILRFRELLTDPFCVLLCLLVVKK